MKKAYLTIDIEEWYHLDYLKKYDLNKNEVETIPEIFSFLDMLDELKIKATFFTLGEIAHKYADILNDIKDRGHVIGCHGLDHDLLYNKTDEEFKQQVLRAKEIIDNVLGEETVKGYRASCFSMERNKLDILEEIGFEYDSSYISFSEHPLYGELDLGGYDNVDDLIYKKGNFYEIEIPTYKIGRFNIPISGGGYLRLFPYSVISSLIKKYLSKHDNFLIYLHPFELTNIPLSLPKEVKFKDKFRASIGRKNNLKKLEKIIKLLLNEGVQFTTIEEEYLRVSGGI